MIAESLAVSLVALAVIAPGSSLIRLAWKRGGVPRKVAAATVMAAGGLVLWLFTGSGDSNSDSATQRISQFLGAWGLLFMAVGIVVIATAALGKFRAGDGSDDGA